VTVCYYSEQINKDEIDGACRTNGDEEKCVYNFSRKKLRKKDSWEMSEWMKNNTIFDIKENEARD
jgi:hypothetical protein